MIPVNEPEFCGNELKYLKECIETGWVSSEGAFVKKFEDSFAKYIGKEYGIAVNNGTAALETSLYAAGIGKGDEVILSSFTIISCAIAIVRVGAIPVLVDIEPETWNMDVHEIEEKITKKTKAIMPIHIYGHPVDMDPIIEIANKYDLVIIEDAAEAHGAEYKGQKCGSIGNVSSFSFYANKLVTTGEGGMILTDDEEIAKRAKRYRNLHFGEAERFKHDELGYNFRMSNLQAAIGLAQVERLDDIVNKKRDLGQYYFKKIDRIPGIRFQTEKPWAKTVYWMYSVELQDSKIDALYVTKELKKKGIMTRPFFKGLHTQPALLKKGFFKNESYPNTEKAYKKGFYLPSGLTLTKKKIDEICFALEEIVTNI